MLNYNAIIMAYGVRSVPQNIMSVEFKLFDFMTLRQFIMTFVIVIFSGLFFVFLPGAWKVVVPLFLIIIGGVVIFVPFNGEPFQEFLSSYMEALILPQRRVWHRKGVVVKTARERARMYRLGSDYKTEDEENAFKFAQQQRQIPEQQTLDATEQKFIEDEAKASPKPVTYVQPTEKQNPYPMNSNTNGTNVSSRTVHASVDLDQLQKPQPIQQSNMPSGPSSQSQLGMSTQPVGQIVQPSVQSQIPAQQPQQETTPKNQQLVNQPQPVFIKQESQQPAPAQPLQTALQAELHQSAQELNGMIAPKKDISKEEDEFAPKNYIFGNVEKNNDEPVKGAGIVIRKGDENLEVVYSTENGDFQSHYEYKAGQYILYVNVDSKEFNEIEVAHDPIDPMPVVIRPKFSLAVAETEEFVDEDAIIKSFDNEIFDGTYDSKVFDLGPNYDEMEKIKALEKAKVRDELQSGFANFEANVMESAKQPVQPAPPASIGIQSYEQAVQNAFTSSNPSLESPSNPELTAQQPYVAPVEVSPPISPSSSKMIQDIDFMYLPDSNIQFEDMFARIPNTINGVVADLNANFLQGVLINIIDSLGNVVRTVATDPSGKFYTFAPLNPGRYSVELMQTGHNFLRYSVNLTGNVINPKLIQTIN